MSKLFIANVTRQNQVVCYRLDYSKDGTPNANARFQPARQQDIPPGRQIQLGGDFHISQINDIVEQLQKYGLIGVKDLERALDRRVHPYIFNIDLPVSADVMRKVQDFNSRVLIEQGRDRRQKAAVATNEIVQNVVEQQFIQNGIEAKPADRTEVGFEQEEQSEAGEKRIEEGFRVVPDEGNAGRGGKGGKGKGRRG